SIRFQSLVNHGNLIVDFSNGHPIPAISFVATGQSQPGAAGDALPFINGTVNSGSTVDSSAATSPGTRNLAVKTGEIQVALPVSTAAGRIELRAAPMVVAPGGARPRTASSASLAAPAIAAVPNAGQSLVAQNNATIGNPFFIPIASIAVVVPALDNTPIS